MEIPQDDERLDSNGGLNKNGKTFQDKHHTDMRKEAYIQ